MLAALSQPGLSPKTNIEKTDGIPLAFFFLLQPDPVPTLLVFWGKGKCAIVSRPTGDSRRNKRKEVKFVAKLTARNVSQRRRKTKKKILWVGGRTL